MARALCVSIALIAASVLWTGPLRAESPATIDPGVTGSLQPDIKQPARKKTVVKPASIKATGIGVRYPQGYMPANGVVRWYDERGATLPVSESPVYCHGYGCEFQTPIPINDADFAALQKIFATHTGNAEQERKAISAAVQWWERRASPLLGGPPRKRGDSEAHRRGQTDCLDEATNSTTILVYLEGHGFLKYHRVMRPESRGMLLYAHATAVIEEIGAEIWVVDMWMYDMGDPPDMPTYAEWSSHW